MSNKLHINNISYAGSYELDKGGIVFYLTNKPLWIHRFFFKLLLGWEWKDN